MQKIISTIKNNQIKNIKIIKVKPQISVYKKLTNQSFAGLPYVLTYHLIIYVLFS